MQAINANRVGVIYKLFCVDVKVPDIYVGSTTCIKKRLRRHKHNCTSANSAAHFYPVYVQIRANGGWGAWRSVIVEEVEFKTRPELDRRERHWIETLGATLNTYTPTRSKEEWSSGHKAEITEWHKQRYDRNRDRILAQHAVPQTCECGTTVSHGNIAKHRRTPKHIARLSSMTAVESLAINIQALAINVDKAQDANDAGSVGQAESRGEEPIQNAQIQADSSPR